jgi:MFS transporter, ACS family, hexuronate transporter
MKLPHLRWLIFLLLAGVTMLNYIDRGTLAIVSVDVLQEFHLTETDYSELLALFLVAFAIMYSGSGYIMDRIGTRAGFALFIVGWSLAQMLHGLAAGKYSLAGCRVLLGACEPAWAPATSKTVSDWLKPSQRALGIGIVNAGSSLGSMTAPPLVAYLALHYGWRSAFVVTGAAGIFWVTLWLILYQPPYKNRFLRESEYAEFRDEVTPPEGPTREPRMKWTQLIQLRACWSLVILRFLTDPVVYFVVFWLPQYLRTQRGFDLAMVGKYAYLPFVFAAAGSLGGGLLSGQLLRKGWPLAKARRFTLFTGAAFVPVAIFAPHASAAWMVVAATCIVILGQAIWVSNMMALPVDMFSGGQVGTVTGLAGTGGALGGAIAQLGTGYAVTHFAHGYTLIFGIAGLSIPVSAFLSFWLLPSREIARRTELKAVAV